MKRVFGQSAALLMVITAASAAAASYNRSGQPTATITDEHRRAVISLFLDRSIPQDIAPSVQEAGAAGSSVLTFLSCGATWRSMKPLATEGRLQSNMAVNPLPFDRAEYHPKDLCMDVTRIDGWAMPARNALTFVANFESRESGERARIRFEMVKQSDGRWLFTKSNYEP